MCNMICKSCGCGCRILPNQCLIDANFRIEKFKAYEKPEIPNNVNTFILIGVKNDGLLGQSCFDNLCAAIKSAQLEANAYREENPNAGEEDEKTEFWYYLPEIWYDLLKNYHFVNMYASYMVYYYYKLGYADAEATLDGDIIHTRSGNINENDGTKNITLNDAYRKSADAKAIAEGHYEAFINNYWLANKSRYGCDRVKPCNTNVNCNDNCSKGNVPFKRISTRPKPTAF